MAELRVRKNEPKCLFIFCALIALGNSECLIDLKSDVGTLSPLVIQAEEGLVPDGTSFLLPSMSSAIASFYNTEEVALLCAGNDNRLRVSGITRSVNNANVACDSGDQFNYAGSSVSIADFQCSQIPRSIIKEAGTCSNNYKRLQIGYEVSFSKFIRLIDICFDEANYITSYVNYTLVDGIDKRQSSYQVNDFDEFDYYSNLPVSPETYFTCTNQLTRATALLGSNSLAAQYIKCSGTYVNYVTKAHLAATHDFVFDAMQRATQYHVNVVPMWRSIRYGNWMKLEAEIRQYASNTSREASDLVIYSGTYGVTKLSRYQEGMYLGTDDKNRNVVPVPKYVWKLVYEPNFKEGIVFLVVNNPYQLNFACRCVCAQTKWTREWNRQDKSKGYVYCCTVDNFRRVFTALPNFEVTGLLKKDRPYFPLFPDIDAQ